MEMPKLVGFELGAQTPPPDSVGLVIAVGITTLELPDGPKDYVALDVDIPELPGQTSIILDVSDTAAIAELARILK